MATRTKAVRPSDLPELGEEKGAFLYCRKCHGEFSATRGDYWNAPDKPMKCHGVNLMLVRRECKLVEVR